MLRRRMLLGFGFEGGAGGAGGVPLEPAALVTVIASALLYLSGVGFVESVTVPSSVPDSCAPVIGFGAVARFDALFQSCGPPDDGGDAGPGLNTTDCV